MGFSQQQGHPSQAAPPNIENDYSQQQMNWTQGYDQYGYNTYGGQQNASYGGTQYGHSEIPPQRPETAAGNMQPSMRQGLSSPALVERQEMYQPQQQYYNEGFLATSNYHGEVQSLDPPSRPNTAPRSSAWEQPSMGGDMYNASYHPQKSHAARNNGFPDSHSLRDYSTTPVSPSSGQSSPNTRQAPANLQKPAMGRRPPPGRDGMFNADAGASLSKPSYSPDNVRNMQGGYAETSASHGRAQAQGQHRHPQNGPHTPRGHQGFPRDVRRDAPPHRPRNGHNGPRGPKPGSHVHHDPRAPRDNALPSRERGRPNPNAPESIPPSARRTSPNRSKPTGPSYTRTGSERPKDFNPPRPATAAGTRADLVSERSIDQSAGRERNGRRLSDTLPSHPTPVRPGLMQAEAASRQGMHSQNVQKYNEQPSARSATQVTDTASKRQSTAITHEELDRLRQETTQRPSDQNLRMHLAKRLVEAARTLADEGGHADTRLRNRNRERFVGESHQIVKKLVAENHAEAQFYLADCMGSGVLGIPNDSKEAFLLYQQAAKAGHAQAAYRTAVCCEIGPEDGGGTRKDTLKAFQWYKRAAALGDQPSMYKVGMIQLKGLLGQEVNVAEAVTWLKRAVEFADEQNPHAMHELGTLYDSQSSQRLITPDDAKALDLFTRAANFGFKRSQFKLGQAYEYGTLGCPIDARNSIIWYTRAAAQGEHQSELALSGWYLTGSEGILEHSDVEAYLWARKAALAEPPLAKAMFALGYYTEVGIGCPRSLEEAKKWYSRAAAHQFPKAQERLDELRRGGAKVQKSREQLSRKNQRQQEAECSVM